MRSVPVIRQIILDHDYDYDQRIHFCLAMISGDDNRQQAEDFFG